MWVSINSTIETMLQDSCNKLIKAVTSRQADLEAKYKGTQNDLQVKTKEAQLRS